MTINAELLSLKNDIAAALDGEPDLDSPYPGHLLRSILDLRQQLHLLEKDPDAAPTAEEMEDFIGPDDSALVGCDNR